MLPSPSSPNSPKSKGAPNGAAPENDVRQALALFEGEPHEDEAGPQGGKGGALEVADDASIRDFYAQLVTLLTQENAPPPPKAASRTSLRFALKRRFIPALILGALTFWGLRHVLWPKQVNWTAQTDLLLPPRPAAGAADPFAPPETNYDTAAQVALIGSEKITQQAMARLPVKLRQAGWGTKDIFPPAVQVAPASPDGNSSLVEISVPSSDAEASLVLASEIVNVYKLNTQARSTQNREENLKRTQARVAQVAAQLEAARRDRANLKVSTGVGDANIAQNNSATNILQLQNALDAARRNKASAATTDGTLSTLRGQLQTSQSALQTVLRDFFPDSERARAAQADVDRAQGAVTARESQLQSDGAAQIAELEASLNAARADAKRLPEIERAQSHLDDRITNLESALRVATERLNQLGSARDTIAMPATTLHSPVVGSNSGIQKARALFVALLGALVVGLLSALLFDRLDPTVRATSDPETLWNAPVLGALPRGSDTDTLYRASPSKSGMGVGARTQNIEACYIAQNNILALAQSAGARSILFSSALASEGKAQSAANLAVAMAYGGRETLLIDADFGNPAQHKNFGLPVAPRLRAGVVRRPAIIRGNSPDRCGQPLCPHAGTRSRAKRGTGDEPFGWGAAHQEHGAAEEVFRRDRDRRPAHNHARRRATHRALGRRGCFGERRSHLARRSAARPLDAALVGRLPARRGRQPRAARRSQRLEHPLDPRRGWKIGGDSRTDGSPA